MKIKNKNIYTTKYFLFFWCCHLTIHKHTISFNNKFNNLDICKLFYKIQMIIYHILYPQTKHSTPQTNAYYKCVPISAEDTTNFILSSNCSPKMVAHLTHRYPTARKSISLCYLCWSHRISLPLASLNFLSHN